MRIEVDHLVCMGDFEGGDGGGGGGGDGGGGGGGGGGGDGRGRGFFFSLSSMVKDLRSTWHPNLARLLFL